MPWIIGIDEAGYGPNLGPFVMATTCFQGPEEFTHGNWWNLLSEVVTREGKFARDKIHVADSKKVYSPKNGIKALERNLFATHFFPDRRENQGEDGLWFAKDLDFALQNLLIAGREYLPEECWYSGQTKLPVEEKMENYFPLGQRWGDVLQRTNVRHHSSKSVIVCPPRFNGLLERWGSKSMVLLVSLAEILDYHLQSIPDEEGIIVFVDKHGGRDDYAALLQNMFPESVVLVREQGREQSIYDLHGLRNPVRLYFQVRADDTYFPVALASMLAKYLRELLMLEFNQFWQLHLTHLKSTAGYPVDALRFWKEIAPIRAHLQLLDDQLWRRK